MSTLLVLRFGCRQPLWSRKDIWANASGRGLATNPVSAKRLRWSHRYARKQPLVPSNSAKVLNSSVTKLQMGQIRAYRVSGLKLAPAASSKIEETVKRLKEKHVEKLKEIQKISDINERVKSAIALDQETTKAVALAQAEGKEVGLPKKSLWLRFVEELKHYKSGFVLLFVDIKVSTKIVWKILRGQTLTRRESRQLTRTVGDLFRLVPFLAFVVIPFMEFLLPVALKLFPGMLPSTFATESQTESKYRRQLVAKLEYAKFLQKTLDEMAPTDKNRSSQSARDFVNFYQEIKAGTGKVDNEKIKKFSKLFEDDITLDNMERSQLTAICRILELPPVGPKNLLAFSIEMRLRHLKADDQVIQREGVDNMSVTELQVANKERGMRALGLQKDQLVTQLKDWLDLSLNAQVPPSLLLLSRTLYLSQTIDPVAQLAMSISALPEAAASRTSAEIGMKEGKTRNVIKLEVIKEEQRKIEEEAAETLKREILEKVDKESESLTADKVIKEASEALDQVVPPMRPEVVPPDVKISLESSTSAQSVASSQEAVGEEPKSVPIGERELSVEDFTDLKSAIQKLGKNKTETDTIDELKKELEDYKEDVEDLTSVRDIVHRESLRETKGAQLLYSRVNNMLGRVGKLVENLEGERKKVEDILQQMPSEGDERRDNEEVEKEEKHLVTINELIDCIQHLENTPDAAKLEQIAEVLSLMDDDKDGVIQVNHVMKVIELLGTTHAKLPAKQIRQIVDMLSKEEMLEVEEKIEDSLDKVPSETGELDESFASEFKRLEDAAVKAADAKDIAKDLSDVDNDPSHVKELFDKQQGKKEETQTNGSPK